MSKNTLTYEDILQRLKEHKANQMYHDGFKKSAVNILLIPSFPNYRIVMTSRSQKLKNHRGEMSFPGGRFDEKLDKSLKDTALRETQEEIGITPDQIEIIGVLDDFPTITSYIIRPFVGIVSEPNYQFVKNDAEVSDVVEIPIDFLLKEKLFDELKFSRGEVDALVLSFMYEEKKRKKRFNIWGASAHLISEFLKIVHDKITTSHKYRRPTLEELIVYKEKVKEYKNQKILKKQLKQKKEKN
jgi:8-oxo-dGTP pyrophosphatase MutT (NUDIX family)